jgi:hypothetical protein
MIIDKVKQENLNKLTSEQRKIVDKWEAAAIERAKLIPAICAAHNSGDKELAKKLNKELLATDPDRCDHGRDNKGICALCQEIDDILFPSSEEE